MELDVLPVRDKSNYVDGVRKYATDLSKELEKKVKAERKKRSKYIMSLGADNATEYLQDLLWRHHKNGRQDLVTAVMDGKINRQMRRQKTKADKTRIGKQELINFWKMFYSGEALV